MKLSGAFLATLAIALAQNSAQAPPQPVTVQGVVLDRASRTPIAGATVRVSAANNENSSATTTSGGGGSFSVTVPAGEFTITVGSPGYQPNYLRSSAPSDNNGILEITLDHLAEIRGRLVDDETRKPVAGAHIALVQPEARNINNVNALGELERVTTQEDGSFAFKNLRRGDYYLRIEAAPGPVIQKIPAKDLAPETRDKALAVPEPVEGYGIVLWPGGDPAAPKSPPLKLGSDLLDVGELRLRRYKLHNISGVLETCNEGTSLQVLLLGKVGAATIRLADLDTACGNGFRILNLPESAFTVVAQGGPPRAFVSAAIDAGTRGPLFLNVSPVSAVQILLEVEGVSRENFPADLNRVRIALTPDNAPIKIDAPDEYEAHLFGNEHYRLSVTPPPAYYLKQLSYDGVPSPDPGGFTAISGARSTLRLLLSNQPGTVEVQAPARTSVYLLPEGANYADVLSAVSGMDRRLYQQMGAESKVSFAGLRPGRYEAFLVDGPLPSSQDEIDDHLRHSTAVTVDEGQTSSVSLTLP